MTTSDLSDTMTVSSYTAFGMPNWNSPTLRTEKMGRSLANLPSLGKECACNCVNQRNGLKEPKDPWDIERGWCLDSFADSEHRTLSPTVKSPAST